MEKKMVIVPFDVEMAKKITNGKVDGKIVTRDGRNVRVLCWDAKADQCIVALLLGEFYEECGTYTKDGRIFMNGESPADLMLEIPEYMTFKDGDVIYAESISGSDFIFIKKDDLHKTSKYVSLVNRIFLSFDNHLCCDDDNIKILRKATNEEIQTMINALRVSKHECAKECLKRFFGIEEKPECEFKPFDNVLVRDDSDDVWQANIFSRIEKDVEYPYRCINGGYQECLPYNEQTAHLLGTTDNWEEEK